MNRRALHLFLLLIAIRLIGGWNTVAYAQFGAHPGYTMDVSREMHTIDTEVVLLNPPARAQTVTVEKIFDERLTKEFKEQFEYRFGKTEVEQSLNSPGRYDEYYYFTGQTVGLSEYQHEQRRFGEYMGRRLVEHHADNWAKSSPNMRQVYELKDKVTNLNVEVKKGYKVDIRYSLSGGHLDFILRNPYDWDSRLRVEGSGRETILTVGGAINRLWSLHNMVRFNDGIVQMVATRRLTRYLSLFTSGSLDSKEEGEMVQQNLFLVGFSYSN